MKFQGNYSAGWKGVDWTSGKDALEGGEHVAALFLRVEMNPRRQAKAAAPTLGNRTAVAGYAQPDRIRKKFTGYERDDETGLDFAQARYYANAMGRFMSPDPLLSSGSVNDPQTWNQYAYTLNNPLKYTDPLGLYVYDKSVTSAQRKTFEEALKKGREALKNLNPKSQEYKDLERALNAYGTAGVTIQPVVKNEAGK